MTVIDAILNRITMYRLVLYYLILLLAAALIFCFLGILPYSPVALVFSTVVLLATTWLTNLVFARTFEAVRGSDSVWITALILALIISPVSPHNWAGIGFLIFAGVWAMASKYIFAIGKKHVFNPAAFAIALSALMIGQTATWWVGGNLPLLPFVLIGGLLIVRKIQRFDMVIAFAAATLAAIVLTTPLARVFGSVSTTLLHSSFFFLGLVMLTEPLTAPPSRLMRIAYGAIVGVLFAPNVHIGGFYFTPELALLAGNVFSYAVSPKGRYVLTLTQRIKLADGVYEFAFKADRSFRFSPGQYLEWTLAHAWPDSRGNRRYFTIASAPAESEVRLGVKFYEPMSSFKKALMRMKVGDTLTASSLAGEFVLPKEKDAKVAFIAGGIGVTPFRSMIEHMVETKDARSAVLLYSNKLVNEIAYTDILERAREALGLKTIYAVTSEPAEGTYVHNGQIDAALIEREIPDFKERTFYISGPRGMVTAFTETLKGMGVPSARVRTDYFPGFA